MPVNRKRKVVVVGSGPGGVASAALLASRGFDVSLYEKRAEIGGRCSAIEENGYRFDVGPTFLMMKFVLDAIFEEAGAKSEDYLKFVKLDPMYELQLGDKKFSPSKHPEKTKKEIEKLFPGAGARFDQFLKRERKRFKKLIPCIQRDYSDFSKLFAFDLVKSVPHLSLGKSVFDVLKGYFKDDDLSLLFAFQSKYLGMSAWDCPGGFSMLSFIEHGYGIYHTEGGLARIPESLAQLAEEHGAKIHTSQGIKGVILDGRKVLGVELDSGEKVECDDIVLNADFAQAMLSLFPEKALRKYTAKRLDKMRFSCSTFMMHLGLKKVYPAEHHTIVFAKDYRRNVEEVFNRFELSDDFSFYVRNASVTDPTLAPDGKSSLYVLVPVPNLDGKIDWSMEKEALREKVLYQLKHRLGFDDIEEQIEVEKIITPETWKSELYIYKGATFNLAHNLSQLAYWRPRNRFEELDNCFLVGGGTHPGSGLPTILESARIASNLISEKYGVKYLSKELQLS